MKRDEVDAERTGALLALRESENRCRLLVDTTSDCIYSYDTQLRLTGINLAAAQMLNLAPSEALGKALEQLSFPGMTLRQWTRLTGEVLASREFVREVIDVVRPDGEARAYEMVLEPVLDASGDVTGVRVGGRDISEQRHQEKSLSLIKRSGDRAADLIHSGERKRSARELRESEERLRLALVASNQGTWDLDLTTGQMLVSPQYALSLGHDPEEYHLALKDSWNSMHPEDRDQAIAVFEAYVRGERSSYEIEYRRPVASGEWKWFRALGRATERDHEGRPLRMIGTQSDVTVQRAAEEALRESEARLRQAQKMEAVGQLAGGIAHDFNNVLTVILGYSDMLLASEECTRGSLHGPVLEIKAAAERASTLTRQILAFSRRQALNPEVLCINDLLHGIESLLHHTLGEDIDLAVALHPHLGLVEVDANQFEQVVINLALNARDAMPHGGKLTLETANVELTEDYARSHPGAKSGAHVMLAVSDTGGGMDEETKSHLFEPFFTTKEPGKGTGLGLASVYGVVKQSGGSIFVYSEPGKGSSFKVYLPRVDRPAQRRIAARRVPPVVTGSESILVVEDEGGVRDLVTQVLEGLGYQVSSAGSGDEALGFLKDIDCRVDLLLTDVVLPGNLQGNELARAATAVRPALPVLYMSGYTRNAIVHAGRLDEGVNYIEKPFAYEELARRVREVLDGRAAW